MTWHQTIIVGNLGRDPEVRYFQDGNSVCTFRVAVNESWRDRRTGERRERTTWYQVSAWGALGDTCHNNLSRGSRVMVIGSVSARAFVNREGQPAASLDMRSREVRFLDGRREEDRFQRPAHSADTAARELPDDRTQSFPPPGRSDQSTGLNDADETRYYVDEPSERLTPYGSRNEPADDIPFQ
ncbi:MAG: single-stranded DNA-binding protein [Anaerolineaceae bacterium]|nr:single-stranded DNA-binding protein [Anaerolineaceae bacterium]MCY3935673.1 single-stranded DNA-binding protein [Chloroflexota bacterium]MCY4009590.1 single-stranded DNA-binding protein [Anaerolineaceae bacterium]MCY4105603.1 single-stranded DNA-binding protein [Chloroflexota bacterium]